MAAHSRWALADPEGTRVARFDHEAMVFNPVSWETHYVLEPGASIIEALMAGPQTAPSLVELLIDPEVSDTDARELIEDGLDALRRLGLIREVAS
jgi:PqqD family protein of HPr-rel-A system